MFKTSVRKKPDVLYTLINVSERRGLFGEKNENFEFLTRSTRQTGPTGEKKINQFSLMALIPQNRLPEINR